MVDNESALGEAKLLTGGMPKGRARTWEGKQKKGGWRERTIGNGNETGTKDCCFTTETPLTDGQATTNMPRHVAEGVPNNPLQY